MGSLVVPSDITILEEKKSIGTRGLGLLEWTGLLFTSPMFHINYSKLDRGDMRAFLQRKYDDEDTSSAGSVVKARQEAVRKQVVSKNFMWGGGFACAGLSYWSFRRYNYQSRLLATPFLFYLGTFAGRAVGDIVTGRNAEFGRDRFLGSLPGKVYLAEN